MKKLLDLEYICLIYFSNTDVIFILASMRGSAGSPESPLFAYVVRTIYICGGPNKDP